ncbi:hypothetical protein [Nonomuraea jabiensis]|uniref:hypothetical protein n=1 Tax=Nonomuraea jabiensis TaxID=882448 RepID=UPI0036923B62
MAGARGAEPHLGVERALTAAPVRSTLLRPGAFAGNALAWAWPIKSGAPVSLPYPGSYNDPIHEADLAEAAAGSARTTASRPSSPRTSNG